MDHQKKRMGAFDTSVAERQRVRRAAMDQQNQRTGGLPGTTTVQTTGVDSDAEQIDLVELAYRMLAKWKLIVCLTLIGALIAGVYTSGFVTPLYEATSTIYVLNRSDSAINFSDLQLGNALTQDYIKVFQMWEVHEEVISNLNLPYTYSQMRDMLSIKNDANTRMLDITVTSASPEEAAAISNEYAKVASEYIADTMATDKPNIMSVALVPANPVSPSITRNILLGFILGGIIACAYVVAAFLMDDKFRTAEDIRKYTGLNTLAVVPIESYDGIKQNARKKNEKR